MNKMRRVVSLVLCLLMVISLIPAVSIGASAATEDYTVPAAASQLRRMWSQQNYNSNDYVYGTDLLFWGRVLYARFLDTNPAGSAGIGRAVLRFEARTRTAGETIQAAALALSDEHAKAHQETNLLSPTHTLKYFYKTATGQGGASSKLMIDANGYYLPQVANSVVAYDQFTSGQTAVTDGSTFTNENSKSTFAYPVTIELDVTDAVRAARAKGQNVQFIIMLPKDVFVDGTNIGRSTDFGGYYNGTLYDAKGMVVKSNVAGASLDTSKPVCGKADYYTPVTKNDDEYFHWIFPLEKTLQLEIRPTSEEELFATFKAEVKDADAFAAKIGDVDYMLGDVYETYCKIADDDALNTTLFAALESCETPEAFRAAFAEAVNAAYWMGYDLRLNVEESFGGVRGKLTLEGEALPSFCYVQLEAFTASKKQFSETIMMRDGFAEYNIYDKKDGIVELKLRATADKAGKELIAGERQVDVENVLLPGVFITELANQHTVTYFPDGSAANRGESRQKFQYIELYNYSDKDVDLTDHRFVYNDNKGSHTFSWLLEQEGSLTLKSGEVYVIGVYAADTVKEGLGYATDAQKEAYWDAFNSFYNCDIPVTNRVMIACVASGNADVMLDGINHLERSKDAKVTCSAQIKKGDTVVTEVSLFENRPGDSIAFQFVPAEGGNVQEEFLFVTGCFPGSLLKEQQLGYCEKAFANGTPMLRVSSYNILATEKGVDGDNYTNLYVREREDLFVKYLQDYDVDIVGMQEVNYRWVPLLNEDMPKIGYTCVQGISGNGRTYSNVSGTWDLMNPIYYKTDKFRELERGHGFLTSSFPNNGSQWDSTNMKRTVTWVVLENVETGEIVSFLNTHLILSGKVGRVEQVKLMYKKGQELQKKYGGSIVITGDHNMVENSEPYQAYINGGVVVDSKYETTNHNCIGTCANGNVATDEKYGPTIDYVMVSKDYIVNKYYVYNGIVENGHLSDHAGIYVELYNSAYEDTDTPVITGVENGATYCQSATFSVSDEHLASATLNGEEIANPKNHKILSTGEYTVRAIDVAGREVSVTFTVRAHDYDWTWDPEQTCNAPGKYVGTCKICGTSISYNRPATGIHEKAEGDEGTVVKAATCKDEGIRRFACVDCGTAIDEPIARLDNHVWESEYTVDTPATCKAAGSKSIHCASCDTVKEGSAVVIDRLTTHTAGAWKTVTKPTTSSEGLERQSCNTCGATMAERAIPKLPKEEPKVNFSDVKKSDFFYTPVQWAVAQGVTTGTSKTTFGPEESCTRAQAVTFLWRAAGSPAPKSSKNPFTDVKKNDYFYKAVLWAAENGVTSGTTKTTFSPNDVCTRGQIVTFLWRAQSGKKVSAANPFKDVKKSDFYYDAVLWAVKNGVTTGTSKTTFGPSENCTRGQIVTFLYRAVA